MAAEESGLLAGRVVVCNFTEGDSCLDLWSGLSNEPDKTKDILKAAAGQVIIAAFDTVALLSYLWPISCVSYSDSVLQLDPYVKYERHDGKVNLTGYLGDLWTAIEAALGFSSSYVRMTANMARLMLETGRVDVYLQPIVVTDDEDRVFDHTQPVVTHWYQLFVQRGVPEVSADSYVRAMSPMMWAMTLAALVLLCLVLRGMVWLRTVLGMEAGVDPSASTLGSCFLTVLGSLCSQGWQERPVCLSVRVSVVTTLLFGYLMYNAYSAVLISHLAYGHYTSPFASLQEVAAKGTHILCVRNESYAYFTLKKRGAEWQHVLNRGVCRDASQVDRLADGLCDHNAAVLEIPSVMAAALEARPKCRADVLRVNGRMQRATASLLLRRDFPFTRAIDYMITRCRVSGILDRLEKHYLDGFAVQGAGTAAGHDTVNKGVQVTLEHVRWVLMLYVCFLSVPLLVLAGECVVAWRTRVRARRRRARVRAGGRGADGDLRNAKRPKWDTDDGGLRFAGRPNWHFVDGGLRDAGRSEWHFFDGGLRHAARLKKDAVDSYPQSLKGREWHDESLRNAKVITRDSDDEGRIGREPLPLSVRAPYSVFQWKA